MHSTTDKVVRIVRDGVTTGVSIDGVTKVPTDSRALQTSATTGGEAESGAATTKAVTGAEATVQDSRGTGSVSEDEEERVKEKLVGFHRTETGMQYCARPYSQDPSENTYRPAE